MVGRTGPWRPGSLMARLTPVQAQALISVGTLVEYPHEAVLVLQGGPADEIFVLIDGYVKVSAMTEDGDATILAIRAGGDLIGEFSVLDGGTRSATVQAVGTVVAARISRSRFLAFVRSHPDVRDLITNSVVGKMRLAVQRQVRAKAWDARARLAYVLHDLADNHGEPSHDGVLIGLPLSQFELGGFAGAGESTTERLLQDFRRDGLIKTRYRKIIVLDMARLRGMWDDR